MGPSSEVISLMGDKIAARRFAKRAGVPTTPGSDGAISDPDKAQEIANQIGFPVLLKAAAGGGGRGMRIVERREISNACSWKPEVRPRSVRSASISSVISPTSATSKFRCLAMASMSFISGIRDCSTQRRNQKLVEERRRRRLIWGFRERIAGAAVRLCSEARYKSAGTVEFVFDQDWGQLYFMEMNTRIQVEHPVTEMVTGLDLVKEQLRIASGDALELRQSQLEIRGRAIECRINAEDHERGFAQAPRRDRISRFVCPGGPGVRVDTHIEAGYTVPPFYDSLLAKIVCWGRDRMKLSSECTRPRRDAWSKESRPQFRSIRRY